MLKIMLGAVQYQKKNKKTKPKEKLDGHLLFQWVDNGLLDLVDL